MNEEKINKLKDAIKLERFRNKITQAEMAKELDISRNWYIELENNPNKLELQQAFKISRKLNWNMFKFIDEELK